MGVEVFGRDQELARVRAFLDGVPLAPRALLVEGTAGIGKSTILRWGADVASRSCRVLSCSPSDREAGLAYVALNDLLGSSLDEVLPALPEPQRRALAIALLREEAAGATVDARAVAFAVLTALSRLAAQDPIVLAIDDTQWVDLGTRRVLDFAIRRLTTEPLGVLVTARNEPGAVAPFDLDRAFTADRFERLRLSPMSVGALHYVVRSQLGVSLPRPAILRIHEAAGGNPFYALTIARELLATGYDSQASGHLPIPASLTAPLEARLARLPRRTQDLLLAMAAMSHPTIGALVAVADEPDLVDADIDRAIRAGVVEVEGTRVSFTHPLLAAAHYDAAPAGVRRQYHRRLADTVVDVEDRARHLALAATGTDAAAAAALDDAAVSARARGAPDVAATLWEQARELTPAANNADQWRRMGEAAMCHYVAGSTDRARELWLQIAGGAPAGAVRAAAKWRLAEFRHSELATETQLDISAQALAEAEDDDTLRAVIHHTTANTLTWYGDVRRARPHADAALELAEQGGDPVALALALTSVLWTEFAGGRGIREDLAQRAAALEESVSGLPQENNPRAHLTIMRSLIGESPDTDRREWLRVRRVAEEAGYEVSVPLILAELSGLECRAGDWDAAERYAKESAEIAAQTGQAFRRQMALCALANVLAHRGFTKDARAAAEEALTLAAKWGPWYIEARILTVLAFIEMSEGHAEEAHRLLGPVVDREDAGGYGEPTALRSLPDEIEALLALGDVERAAVLVDRLEEQGRRLGRAWALATAARCRGLLEAARGDLALALGALEGAVEEHRRLPEPFELGRTLLALADVQRRCRQKRAPRETLEKAAAIFEQLGATTWLARARADLQRLGTRAPSRDELTATEQRVAEMVGDGRTNREIAVALFVSVKAVEANLTRIYAKLEVRSRTELALRMSKDRPLVPTR